MPPQRSQPPGDVGRAIKALRERQGLTDVQLARLSRNTTETIQRIESGLTQRPSYVTLGRIARALKVDERALLDGGLPPEVPDDAAVEGARHADATDDPAAHAPLALRDAWRSGDFTDDDLRAVADAVPPDAVAEGEVVLMRVWLRAARSLRLVGRGGAPSRPARSAAHGEDYRSGWLPPRATSASSARCSERKCSSGASPALGRSTRSPRWNASTQARALSDATRSWPPARRRSAT